MRKLVWDARTVTNTLWTKVINTSTALPPTPSIVSEEPEGVGL